MNYDDASQQQFYMQRMQTQQQRMVHPIVQNQQNMQQQQIIRQQQSYSGMMHSHQQQVMVRMPQTMNEESIHSYQQHPQIRDIIQTFPTHMQNQINSETNPEIKKQLFQAAMKHQQQQQQIFEQQMQGGMSLRMPMNMSSQNQRLPMPQNYPTQQPIIMQQSAPTQIQRIPSQGSFGQSPSGQQSQPMAQMYITNAAQMNQNRMAPMQPMPINQPSYVQVQQHQISQQQQSQQGAVVQQQQQQMQKHSTIQNHQQQQKNLIPSVPQLEQQQNSSTGIMMNIGVGQQVKKIPNSQILQQILPGDQSSSSNEQYQSVQPTLANTSSRTQNIADHKQPCSVGTPLSMGQQQQPNEPESLEYKTLFDRLRTYHGDIKRILDRLNIDYPGEMKLKAFFQLQHLFK